MTVAGFQRPATADEASLPERRPLASQYESFVAPAGTPGSMTRPQAEEPTGTVTLETALALALRFNPELAVFSWEVRAREAAALQAGLRPNPEIALELEEFAGSGDASGFEPAETTVRFGQLFERAGKRAKRVRLAVLDGSLAGWDYESKRLDVVTEVFRSFLEVIGQQERVELARDLAGLAEGVLDAARRRVEAGKVSALEETRARVAHAQARIVLEKEGQALLAARHRLAATWGSLSPKFDRADGALAANIGPPAYESLVERLAQNPAVARWDAEIAAREASVALAQALAVSDVTVAGGVRRFSATGDHALVFEISMPLPLFDRNQGGIQEGRIRLAQARTERDAAITRVTAELQEAYRALTAAHARVVGLREQVLPGATQVFEAATEGYREGKFDLLFVLDAQRTLFDARAEFIDALLDFNQAAAAVERLIGQSLDGLASPQPPMTGGTGQ